MDTEDDVPVKTLTKLETEGSFPNLFVLTVYEKGTLTLKVSDGKQMWDGTFHEIALSSMAEKAKLAFNTFLQQSLHALTQYGNEDITFAFSATIDSSNNLLFAWKKHIVSENVKFQIAAVTLHQSLVTISSMLKFAVCSISSLKEDISSLTKTVEDLEKERSQALEKLEHCATLKEDIESDLYGKFKLVLNDKKAKIRLLSEQVKTLTEENQRLKDKNITAAVTSAKTKRDHIAYDSEATTDDEAATTDNKQENQTPSPVSKITDEEESVDASVSVSSLLGERTEKISSPPVKRRRVREVKKPPKKPVITKPVETALKKAKPPSRPTRSSSNASSHSSIEADDLLEKM